MGVTVSGEAKVYSLTSPPVQPNPKPPSELIAEEMMFGDRTILVTVPFPDTIELTADVLNEHLTSPHATGGSAKNIYKKIDEDLKEFAKAVKDGETLMITKPYVSLAPKSEVVFEISYDPAQPLHRARLTLARQPGIDYGSWSVRLEFSASKAQAAGLVKLTAAFEEALDFNFSKMLPDFRVSRVDPAIDLIGARPLDLIAHIENPGKRLVYVGKGGLPESLYLFEQKKALKKPPSSLSYNTLGTLRLKLYERRDYFRQLMLDPPYGECPVTRIEVEQRWKKKAQRPKLAELADIKNVFDGRRVGYAAKLAEDIKNPKKWISFCLAAFGGGVSTAQNKWQSASEGLMYRKFYQECEGDLVNAGRWENWHLGIASTGLDAWTQGLSSEI